MMFSFFLRRGNRRRDSARHCFYDAKAKPRHFCFSIYAFLNVVL